jgi:hypothetical protein
MKTPSRPSSSKNPKEIQPFLAGEEIQDDDWLIDDIGPTNKKRRLDVNDVFLKSQVPSSQRRPKSQVPSSQRRPKRKKHSEDREQAEDLDVDSENSNDDADSSVQFVAEDLFLDDLNGTNRSTGNQDIDPLTDSENSNDSVNIIPRLNRPNRKPKQSKLTNFGVIKSSSCRSDESTIENANSLQGLSCQSNPVRSGVTVSNAGVTISSSQAAPGYLTQSVTFPVGTLRVSVKDKKLLVPVFEK